MVLCQHTGYTFKAYSFDDVSANSSVIPVEKVVVSSDPKCKGINDMLEITKKNGFKIALHPGEFLTVWDDGDVLTASAATVEQYRIK